MRALPVRTALVTTAVGCLVLLYVLWWTTYAGIHFEQRFVQQPPGAAGQVGGTSIRLLSLTATPLLADQEYGGNPEATDPGAVWVVAVAEAVQAPGAPEFYCTLELLGPDGRRWEKANKVGRTLPYCRGDEVNSGRTVRFESIFLVPERFVGGIVGVALLDPAVTDRADVIRPPAG
jgi:hypothetical protein